MDDQKEMEEYGNETSGNGETAISSGESGEETLPQDSGDKASAGRTKNMIRELFSGVMVVVCAFVLAFVVTHYVIIKAEVPTGSMISTIQVGDRLIGNRLAYLFSDPKRGDIVIFPYPDNEEETYIKRIVGLPGETLEIVDGVLYIDGKVYEEDYLNEPMTGSFGPFTVPEGHYFMMGDNRNRSWDSRYWTNHYVAKSKILGKAWLRYEPSWGLLK